MSDFVGFANACGLAVDRVYASDKIIRCATHNKPKQKNGAYFFDGDRGWCQAWDGDGFVHWWGTEKKPWTDEDKRRWAAQRRASENEKERRHELAGMQADSMIRAATLRTHDYLIRKGFAEAQGFVDADNVLLIPMRGIDGAMRGLQRVFWDVNTMRWEKKMLHGTRAKGAIYRIGNKNAPEAFLCEGYATGLSIKAALDTARFNASVVVCFSDSNMAHVATQLRGRRFVCADNDKSEAGERAAKATGLPYCMADTLGQDMNDLHQDKGLFAVVQKLMQVRRM